MKKEVLEVTTLYLADGEIEVFKKIPLQVMWRTYFKLLGKPQYPSDDLWCMKARKSNEEVLLATSTRIRDCDWRLTAHGNIVWEDSGTWVSDRKTNMCNRPVEIIL